MATRPFRDIWFNGAFVGTEHDDDLGSTVDMRDDVEIDDIPRPAMTSTRRNRSKREPTRTKLLTKASSVNELASQLIDAV